MIRRALVTSAVVLFVGLALPPALSAQNVFVLGGATIGTGLAFGGDGNVSPLLEVRYQGSGDEDVDLNFIGIAGGVSIGLGN